MKNKKLNPQPVKKQEVNTKVIATELQVAQNGNHNLLIQKLLILVFAFGLYANTLNHEYTLDDMLFITHNQFTLKGTDGFKDILFNDAFTGFYGEKKNLLPGGRYRPLSQLMFAAEYQYFKLKPFVGHIINVVLYTLICLFLFNVMRMVFKEEKVKHWWLSLPFLATLIFTIHPLHTEVVASIKGRDEILSLFFGILMIYLTLKYLNSNKVIYLIFLPLAYFFGLLSKENTVTFFAVVPLTMYFFTKAKTSNYIPVMIALLAGFGLYALMRYEALGFLMNDVKNSELLNEPFLYVDKLHQSKFATLFYTYWVYLKLLFFPHPLTHDYYPYHIELTTWSNSVSMLSLVLYLGIIGYAIIRLPKKDIIAYGILFYLTVFSISSNIAFNIGAFMNERFVFIALLGFAIIIAYLITNTLRRKLTSDHAFQTIAGVLIVFLVVGFSVKTFTRNKVWKDDYTLFTTDVKVSKNSAKVNTSAAGKIIEKAQKTTNEFEKEKLLNQAIKYLETAVKIHPTYSAAWVLYGNAYYNKKDFTSSVTCYENAIKITQGGNNDAITNMLAAAQQTARDSNYTESTRAYEILLKYKKGNAEYLYGVAANYSDLMRIDTALQLLDSVISIDPKFARAYSKKGELIGRYKNNIDMSERYLVQAYSLDSNYSPTLENLGIVYAMKKEFKKSLEFSFKALNKEPENKRTLLNIAATYADMGNKTKAQEYRQKALNLPAKK